MPVRFTVTDAGAPRREAAPGVLAAAQVLARDAATNTPVRSGTMRRGWRAVQVGNSARVINDVEYARFVEFGTRHMAPRAPLGRAMADARAQLGQ
jgi:HK97 gp10 family phage protein